MTQKLNCNEKNKNPIFFGESTQKVKKHESFSTTIR
jgi:hypothetical protein